MNPATKYDVQFWACLIMATVASVADHNGLGWFWIGVAAFTVFLECRAEKAR